MIRDLLHMSGLSGELYDGVDIEVFLCVKIHRLLGYCGLTCQCL